jgi:hypothetical protein
MKTQAMLVALLLGIVALARGAAQELIVLKSGTRYYGIITNVTDQSLSIITQRGMLKFPWTALNDTTIKLYNPVMYEKILDERRAKFEELKRKEGLVPYKGKWMKPAQKEIMEKRDQGLELFEEQWLPTNKIAQIKYRREMEAQGKKEYKGQWYTDEELASVKEMEAYRGLKIGMTESEVIAAWGEPTNKKTSPEFASRKREMWFYQREDEGKEDRLVFEMSTLREVYMDQELTDL